MARCLHFQTILDSRFSPDANRQQMDDIKDKLKAALISKGLLPAHDTEAYRLDFPPETQGGSPSVSWRRNWYITKPKSARMTWQEVMHIVNEAWKPVHFTYIYR